ncbi:MAG: hypothetical protein H7328_05185 [Bdellovibrio sp.]|nr:hypothetical protein [Bdellovibrio sp.]
MALEKNAHLQELKELFPYALLTDDFGILNKDDLKMNQCIAEPSLFSENSSTFYPYWQCFEIKDAKIVCEGKKYSTEEKSQMTMLVISGTRNNELNEFISRRPMKLKTCHLYLRDWARFTKNEKHVCVSGDFIDSEINKADLKKRSWIFDRYKTKKGCDAYFRGTCVPNENAKEFCVMD